MTPPQQPVLSLPEIVANSYRDFHAKGLDYLCLHRSPERTLKVYFFDGEVETLPEVVIPHDHRYAFETAILAGGVINRRYHVAAAPHVGAQAYEVFDYRTPLNGGDGFSWARTAWLSAPDQVAYGPGQVYCQRAEEIHTIQIFKDQTILLLEQGPDVVALDAPTAAYRPAGKREAPSLDGLYSRMTPDHALKRLEQLTDYFPGLQLVVRHG